MQDRIYFLSDEGTLRLNGDDYGASGAGSNEIPVEIKTRSEGEPFVLDFTGGRIQKYTMDSAPSMNDPYLFFSIVDSDLSGVTQTIEVHVPIGSKEDDYNGEELPYMFPSSCILSQDKFKLDYGSYDDDNMLDIKHYNVFIAKATRDENGNWKHYVNLDHSYPDAKPIEVDYLSFTPHGNNQVKLQFIQHRYNETQPWYFGEGDFNLEYSYDKQSWSIYSYAIDGYNEEAEVVAVDPGETVYFRGNNDNFYAYETYQYYMHFSISGACDAGGNVSTLLRKSGKVASLENYAFFSLFRECKDLVTPPKLPEVADGGLAQCAYQRMFSGTGIRVAPQIPVVKIKNPEYPDLEFETVNGTSLDSIAACFGWMFEDCFNLEIPPSSLSLGAACYDICYHMFYNCVKLKRTPEMTIPLTVYQTAFYGMFEGCTSLTDSYVKFSMDVDSDVFKFMLYNYDYSDLETNFYCKNFQGSYGLQFGRMFARCSSLSAWHYPMKLGGFKVENDEYSGILSYLISWSYNSEDQRPFDSMFDGCWNLKDISFLDLNMFPSYTMSPDTALSALELPRGYFVHMFMNCGVEEIPSSLCLTQGVDTLVSMDSSANGPSAMFNYMENTFGGIPFPHKICVEMFEGCSALVHVPSTLFAKADSQWHFLAGSGSFTQMFEGCKNLEDQIYLPFVKTKQDSYARMFMQCSNPAWKGVKVGFTDASSFGTSTGAWLLGASNTSVQTFTAPAALDTSSITRGDSTIPSNWTIIKE